MHLVPPRPPFRNSFKQTSYRPIPYNGQMLLYNLAVPEIPVRRPSQQIKTSAHHSNPTKGLLLTVVLKNCSRDTQCRFRTHTQRKDTWPHNGSRSTKGTATRRNKEVTKLPINWTAIRTRRPSFSYFRAARVKETTALFEDGTRIKEQRNFYRSWGCNHPSPVNTGMNWRSLPSQLCGLKKQLNG